MTSATENTGDHSALLRQQLQIFTTRHTSHHLPIALVTSGGTSAPLEHNCVRYIENFSTGTRGAHAVEEFCKRGYAVIHLKREGSVSPFGRVLGNLLKCGSGGPTFDSLGVLFDCAGTGNSEDEEECDGIDDESSEVNETVASSFDPWMYSNINQQQSSSRITKSSPQSKQRGELSLNPRLVNSQQMQSTLRNYKRIKRQGLLLTIEFTTVDDYLHKLQLCSEAIQICGSLALVYLTAAVSDFFIPEEKRTLHKIQSRDYGIQSSSTSTIRKDSKVTENGAQIQPDNTLTMTLYPVTKVIPTLRRIWCPHAFVVSFKLETDASILRQKSVLAMEKNDVHLVIGNELTTRYEKVFILSRTNDNAIMNSTDDINGKVSERGTCETSDLRRAGYHTDEVTAAYGQSMMSSLAESNSSVDALECATIEYVTRRHFHYISTTIHNTGGPSFLNSTSAAEMTARCVLEATSVHEDRLSATYRQLQRERIKVRVFELVWNAAGSLLGMALSYGIARMLSGRQH
ncbi:hypothetical protein ACHAXH_008295, partial [Discostella pseudostelligera]